MSHFQLSPRQQKITITSRLNVLALKKIITPIEACLKKQDLDKAFRGELPKDIDEKNLILLTLLRDSGFDLRKHQQALNQPLEAKTIEVRTVLSPELCNELNQVIERQLMFSLISKQDKALLSTKDMQVILDEDAVELNHEAQKLTKIAEDLENMRSKLDAQEETFREMKAKIASMRADAAADNQVERATSPSSLSR